MASYNLNVICAHQVYTLTVHPHTSWNEINKNITSRFNLAGYSFNLEIYNEQIRMFVDFDEQYDKDLRQRLPKTHKQALQLRVTFYETSDSEGKCHIKEVLIRWKYLIFSTDDMLSSSGELETSLVGSSPMEDQTIVPTNYIDIDFCLLDDSPKLSNGISTQNLQDDCRHIVFVRDVIPYEKSYYLTGTLNDDEKRKLTKGNYIRRVQGIKNNSNERYSGVLPEVKVSFSHEIIILRGCHIF